MLTLKKSLGQHFLVDEQVCRQIVDKLFEMSFTNLVEIGPGGGALTKYLVKSAAANFKCIELDREKVEYLQRNFPALKGRIINEDILTTTIPFEEPFIVVGNFPYNISTQIVFRIIEWKEQIQGVIGMFQKEVAERIASKEGSKIYGVTSVLVQAYFTVEYLFEVPENAFKPPPKVKSAVIRLTPRKDVPAMRNPQTFSLLVKTAFNQRRKTMRNAVRGLFDAAVLADPLFDRRAETLSVEDFASLTFRMK